MLCKLTKALTDGYCRKITHPEFQIVSNFFRPANPRARVTGTGTSGLPGRGVCLHH